MNKNLVELRKIKSSFLSCEKDSETILKKLFIESRPYSDILKRLLVINTKDCMDETNVKYKEKIDSMSIKKLIDEGYIRLQPKLHLGEHEEVKSYILISFDSFTMNSTNPEFRDCIINFDIICHTDHWDLGDYKQRPLKICGYIDGLLDDSKLSGIGTLHFAGCNQLVLNENLTGYTLSYFAIHGSDDYIPRADD